MRKTQVKLLWVLIAAICGTASVSSAAREDHSPALMRVLRAIDIVPSPAQLASVTGDHPEGELYAVALDPTLAEYVRTRATSLLSVYPNRLSATYLESIAELTALLPTRWMAVYTRIRAFQDAEAVSYATSMLQSPVTRIRHAVIRGLRWVPGAAATEALRNHLTLEPTERLRKTTKRMLELRRDA